MSIDRRDFLTLGAGTLLGARLEKSSAATNVARPMLKLAANAGFESQVLTTIGEAIGDYRMPGIPDGTAAWRWNDSTVRVFINHEFSASSSYEYTLANGTPLRGARISWLDIDRNTRQVRSAGNAIRAVFDRNGQPVRNAAQINENSGRSKQAGLNTLCSAQGYASGEMGFVDDLMFTHEEVSATKRHPHGGSVWALAVRDGTLWALPELGRGSWENSTAISTPDGDEPDGHIALLLADDLETGGAPLYLWIGKKNPGGNLPERNGLSQGQLHVWVADEAIRSPQDWRGTGATATGQFVPIATRDSDRAGKRHHDERGYRDDPEMRRAAEQLGAFMFSRPEDLHTNPRNGTQVAMASTGQGDRFPADDWGTIYQIDIDFAGTASLKATARLSILHDCDECGDCGIRSADNLVWASDGILYIEEDMATKLNKFGGETGIESSVWKLDPTQPDSYSRIATIDRSAVWPPDAKDKKSGDLGVWEPSGIIDVSAAFGMEDELVLLTTVQAHTLRGGALGGRDDLYQGGQVLLLSAKRSG